MAITETVAYKCECGKKYHTKKSALRHENVCTCWTNPKFKTCKSCKWAKLEYDSNGMEHEQQFLHTWREWKCTNPKFHEGYFKAAHENAPDLNINCFIWEQK